MAGGEREGLGQARPARPGRQAPRALGDRRDRPGAARRHQRARTHAVPRAVQPAGPLLRRPAPRPERPRRRALRVLGSRGGAAPDGAPPVVPLAHGAGRTARRQPHLRAPARRFPGRARRLHRPGVPRGARPRAAHRGRARGSAPPRRRMVGPAQLRAGHARVPVRPGRARGVAGPQLRARLRPAGARRARTRVRARPTPPAAEAQRQLLAQAARSLGVATASNLASCYAIRSPVARPRVAELVEAGELLEVAVEGWAAIPPTWCPTHT